MNKIHIALFASILILHFIPSRQFLVDKENGKYDLTWTLSENKSSVTFEINLEHEPEVYVALGVSPDGEMENSDVAVYQITDGKPQLQVNK